MHIFGSNNKWAFVVGFQFKWGVTMYKHTFTPTQNILNDAICKNLNFNFQPN